MSQSFSSARAPEPVGPYVHARKVGNLLFLAGLGPRAKGKRDITGVVLDEGGEVKSYDFEAQCRSVLDNVKIVLEDAGASLADVVDVTVFLTNMRDDFATMNRIYAEYFGGAPPTRTTVEVTRLPTPIAIELKVIAELRD